MQVKVFKGQLNALEDSLWQQLSAGDSLIISPDLSLQIVHSGHAENLLTPVNPKEKYSPQALKKRVLEQADFILETYFTDHPLTSADFNQQIQQLVDEFGARSFMATYPNTPDRTIFVEGGIVIAEQPDSPRHRYGIFLEIDNETDLHNENLLQKWLNSGQAYQEYLSSNCCRYSCR